MVIATVTFLKLADIENPPNSGADGIPVTKDGTFVAAGAKQRLPPDGKSLNILVNGQQYLWRYTYPDGDDNNLNNVFSYQEMVVPTNTTVTLEIRAQDVAHSWWIPKLGGKFDAIPGSTNYTWFKATQARASSPASAPSSAAATTPNMTAQVRAVSPAEFEALVRGAEGGDRRRRQGGRRQAQRADRRGARQGAGHRRRESTDEQASETPDGNDAERTRSPSTSASRRSRRARSAASRPAGPRWLTTTDHKRIGIMYLVLSFAFFMIGGVEALLMRLQLAQADNTLLEPQTYNALFTMHGTTMIFLFVVPMVAGFGNYFVPLMIGARDMAFPRLNALSFWFFVAGGAVFYSSLLFGPPECGWTCYAPLSESAYSPTGGVDAWIYLVHLTGISSLLGAVNFYVTIVNMRAPGMGWGRMPLFVWAILTFSILLILALPVIAGAVTLLLPTATSARTSTTRPTAARRCSGSTCSGSSGTPRSTSWCCPAFGIVSEVLPVFSRKPIFGYKAIAAATIGIAFLGLLVWAHHMFATPSPTYVLIAFMLGVVPDRACRPA